MKIVLASRNVKKIAELKTILHEQLSDLEILSLDEVGLLEEIEETGSTFEENAMLKARAAAASGYIGVGDDSGLTVDALNGEPGVYSARYAERNHYVGGRGDEANNRLLLERLEQVPDGQRGGAFVCCIACALPDGRAFTVRGEVRGCIRRSYRGQGGFGYDPLFDYPPLGKTFAELTPEEKNAASHRGIALRKFAEQLQAVL